MHCFIWKNNILASKYSSILCSEDWQDLSIPALKMRCLLLFVFCSPTWYDNVKIKAPNAHLYHEPRWISVCQQPTASLFHVYQCRGTVDLPCIHINCCSTCYRAQKRRSGSPKKLTGVTDATPQFLLATTYFLIHIILGRTRRVSQMVDLAPILPEWKYQWKYKAAEVQIWHLWHWN